MRGPCAGERVRNGLFTKDLRGRAALDAERRRFPADSNNSVTVVGAAKTSGPNSFAADVNSFASAGDSFASVATTLDIRLGFLRNRRAGIDIRPGFLDIRRRFLHGIGAGKAAQAQPLEREAKLSRLPPRIPGHPQRRKAPARARQRPPTPIPERARRR